MLLQYAITVCCHSLLLQYAITRSAATQSAVSAVIYGSEVRSAIESKRDRAAMVQGATDFVDLLKKAAVWYCQPLSIQYLL